MAKKVPFVSEGRIARADDDENAESKKSSGRVIDEVISTISEPSSWDDVAVNKKASPSAPIEPRPAKPIEKPPARIATPTPSNSVKKPEMVGEVRTAIDWVPINNGHALRINVAGNMDGNMRKEWAKMMDEFKDSKVGQFEFNLTQTTTLGLTGLGMLLSFKEEKRSKRGDIKLCHCSKEVWQMLQWTGMDKYFVIQNTPDMK